MKVEGYSFSEAAKKSRLMKRARKSVRKTIFTGCEWLVMQKKSFEDLIRGLINLLINQPIIYSLN